ncbi:MAG: hypothetical protein NT043_01595, partial [Candidatus Bathyarchaeota archaeon]|nr:hypothetical protein [Candidatus Bathyarchaeota archaeon]
HTQHARRIGEIEHKILEHRDPRGTAIEFKRCRAYDYRDKTTVEKDMKTCTEKTNVHISQNTLDCYNDRLKILEHMKRGQKGRRGINHKILALLTCSVSATDPAKVPEPMTTSIISVTAQLPPDKVYQAIKSLKTSGKIKCGRKFLPVLWEQPCRVTLPYMKAFDKFIQERKEGLPTEIPAGAKRLYWEQEHKPPVAKKLSEQSLRKFEEEAEEWKRRTRIVQPKYLLSRQADVTRGEVAKKYKIRKHRPRRVNGEV